MKKLAVVFLSIVLIVLCIACDRENQTIFSKVENHNHIYSKQVTKATCTSKGYTKYTCSCGDTYISDYVNPSHNYSSYTYTCTQCGDVNKSYAYEYLEKWVINNGKRMDDGTIHVTCQISDALFALIYSDSIGLSAALDGPNTIEAFVFLKKINGDFYYMNNLVGCKVSGSINGKTYKAYSAITCEEYSGPSDLRSQFIDYTESMIGNLVTCLDYYLDNYVKKINIKDLGFENV